MKKVGEFLDRNGSKYTVVCDYVHGKGERIELLKRPEDYSLVDTYNAVSAYYRKNREFILGDENLIKDYLYTLNSCLSSNGVVSQKTSISKEGFIVEESKVNDNLSLSYTIKMLNGTIIDETYIKDNSTISIGKIEDIGDNLFVDPINLYDYKPISILTEFIDDSTLDADYYSLETLKSRYPELDHIYDYDYVIVKSLEEARERLETWKTAKVRYKSYDVETTGLGVNVFGEDLITGVVLSYDWEPLNEVENSTYFPFRQKNFKYNLPIEFMKEIVDAINSQPESISIDPEEDNEDGVVLITYNGKMERKSFWMDNYEVRSDADGYTLSTLIETRMEKGLHTLKNRAKQATNLFWIDLEHIFKNKLIRFDILPEDIVHLYACPDAPNTIKVFKYLFAKLPRSEYSVFEIENKLQRCKSINEFYGLRLDQEALMKRLKNVEYCSDKLATMFKTIHKTSKNINSADVLRNIIYNKLGCEVIVRTKKNKPSTSADAIDNIVSKSKIRGKEFKDIPDDVKDLYGKSIIKGIDLISNKYPSLVILSKYNKFKKELGALRRLQKKSIRNRVMFGINGTGAASGRQTSDAHQYSDTMKSLVLSDTPEHRLISADYSQVELRVLAYVIQDKNLIEMMKDKHIDIHRAFLSLIYGIPVHMISAKMRKDGKRVNFGVVYRISEYGLANDKYGPEYTKEQLIECRNSITDFYNAFPGVKELAEENRKFVFENGYIETKFGYRRMFPEVFNPDLDNKAKNRIFRAANNTPIQGFAAHLMKSAEVNYDNYIRNKGWDKTITYMDREFPLVRVMLSIHDEVLISAHKSIPCEEIVKMCKECMEISIPEAPPFFAVPAFIDNWYQGKQDEFEMTISMRDDILESWESNHETIVDWNNLEKSIKDYKLNQIRMYMNDLINKYHTEEEVIKHVNHPEFTHLLISIYVSENVVKTSSHEDCIALAVKAFMENSDNIVEVDVNDSEFYDDTSIQDSMKYLKELEEYVEIDENGEAILPDKDLLDEDDYDSIIEAHEYVNEDSVKTDIGVLYMGNIVIVDTTDIKDLDRLKQFHSEIVSLCNPNGYYQLNYMRGPSLMPTKLRMDSARIEILDLISKYKGGE